LSSRVPLVRPITQAASAVKALGRPAAAKSVSGAEPAASELRAPQ
jgi:hypothetical protein